MSESTILGKYYLSEENESDNKSFRFGLSIKCVIFGYHKGRIKALLIERGVEPCKDAWALPCDLVSPDEELDDASKRILKQLTGLENIFLEQFHTFGRVDRHPAGRVITVGYYSLVRSKNFFPVASSWASKSDWVDIEDLPELAFDHKTILNYAVQALKTKVRTAPVGFELLPAKFTLLELQKLYETLLGYKLDKPNFRKKILAMDVLIPLNELQENVAHRPAKLFKFDQRKYAELEKGGFNFEI